ncbi:MAG: hypothetical protein LBI82_04710 [Dysgonamonadaceae bacterium]|jgi:hypothetical protein|nr:hypothetical protein [Dysgonamonadaceae bacterium]
MKTKVVLIMVEKLLAIKEKIIEKTNDFIRAVKDVQAYDNKLLEFEVNNDEWNSHTNLQKVRWMLVLFIVVPMLILVDYASLKLFIDYLQFAVDSIAIGKVLETTGIVIFFVLELAICFSIIRLNEYLDREPNLTLKIVKILLMLVMITLPSILIYTGYLLLPFPGQGDTMKTFALILLSIAIHTALFILIDDVLRAVTYIVFLIRKQFLLGINPTKNVEKLKKELLKLYARYDVNKARLSEFPGSQIYNIELGKREQILRNQLEDGLDILEIINMKNLSSKPLTTILIPISTSTVW